MGHTGVHTVIRTEVIFRGRFMVIILVMEKFKKGKQTSLPYMPHMTAMKFIIKDHLDIDYQNLRQAPWEGGWPQGPPLKAYFEDPADLLMRQYLEKVVKIFLSLQQEEEEEEENKRRDFFADVSD